MMSVITSVCTNPLREFLANRSETIWTGYGASYAMASAIACTLRLLGYNARELRPSKAPRGQNTAFVSQSGNGISDVGFVIAGCSTKNLWNQPSLLVDDTDIGVAWFPVIFQKRTLFKISELLGIEHKDISARSICSAPVLLVLDDYTDQIQLLINAAKHKLCSIQLCAVSIDDFAHGPHVCALGESEVCIVKTREDSKPFLIKKWLNDHHRPVDILDINPAPEATPLTLYTVALNAITAHAQARNINLAQSRIAPEDDKLRKIVSSVRNFL